MEVSGCGLQCADWHSSMKSLRLIALVLGVVACESAPAEDEQVDEQEADWTAHSAEDEATSTHLFIVDRAIELLGKRTDLPRAQQIAAMMNEPECRTQWQKGLCDADYLAAYNDGSMDMS